MTPPIVFISYSHDSAEHKEWVLQFATTLRYRGIDAVLDQWDLKPGEDLPQFMETNLERADFILMICTNKYVQKANQGEGGVGYEKMIITSNLLSRIDNSKVIPIIRQMGTSIVPTFLKTKLYIDFSMDDEAEYNFDHLVRTLLNAPLYIKPEIGKNPFVSMEHTRPDRTADGIRELMVGVADTYALTHKKYITFGSLIRKSSLHRLSLEKYIDEAIKQDLLRRDNQLIHITNKGREYLFAHKIIDA